MSDDRELVERLAAIDATPRASWVAELRADLNAAWETEDAGYLDSLRRTTLTLVDHEPTPTRPTRGRRWPTLIAATAATAATVVAIALVVSRDTDDTAPGDQPSPTVTVPPTTPSQLVEPPGAWSPELTAQALELPIPCSYCVNLAVSPDGTLVALDRTEGTLTWFEDEPRVVPLAGELRYQVAEAMFMAIGPHDIAYIAMGVDYVAVAPSGTEINRVADTSSSRQPTAYATASGLVRTRFDWLSPYGAPEVPWIDLDGNPITDIRPYPTTEVTDAGIEVRLGERQWLIANQPGIRPRALDFLPRSDGGVVIVLDTWGFGQGYPGEDGEAINLLELLPDGTIERYFVDTRMPPIVMPDGSVIVELDLELFRLTPPG